MQPFLHEFAAEEKTQSSHDLHEGLNTKEQAAIVDVIYHGKFDKKPSGLDHFLRLAAELQVRGLHRKPGRGIKIHSREGK